MAALEILISGKVQGVYFRVSARDQATALGIHGFVCNLPDGRVLAAAEGSEEKLNQFVQWCHRGPSGAQVTEVVRKEVPSQGFQGFVIKR